MKFILILISLTTFAENDSVCTPYKSEIKKIREKCKKSLMKYADDELGLGTFSLLSIKKSNDQSDKPVRKKLANFTKKCKKVNAKKLLANNEVSKKCYEIIVKKPSPFDD